MIIPLIKVPCSKELGALSGTDDANTRGLIQRTSAGMASRSGRSATALTPQVQVRDGSKSWVLYCRNPLVHSWPGIRGGYLEAPSSPLGYYFEVVFKQPLASLGIARRKL